MRAAIAVVGPADAARPLLRDAAAVGRGLAEAGFVVVTGGLGGVMAAACRGAMQAGGLTVGLLPGTDTDDANRHLTVAVPTGLGQGRNVLLVRMAAALVVVGGSWGTLSEVALGCRMGRPVVTLHSWRVTVGRGEPAPGGPLEVPDATAAVAAVQRLVGRRGR